jgi:hypothetical protein
MSSRTWTVTIPAPAKWLNANSRIDRRQLAPVVKLWREAAAVYARQARLPQLGKARIVAELRFTDKQHRDSHNYFLTVKPVIDGLIDYGLLGDDSDGFLTSVEIRAGELMEKKPYGPVGAVHLIISEVS